jgi:hypothetical protein
MVVEENRQRYRLDARAKLIPRRTTPAYRICVVVGGRGSFRRLADELAVKIGDAVLEAGDPVATVDAIRAASLGRFPRVVLLAPIGLSLPIADEVKRRNERWGLGWPEPVDLLAGLRARDRDAFLRLAIRTARGAT